MPEEEKLRPGEKPVDLDTSGPEVDVTLEETKEEVVDTAPETTTQEVVEEVKTNEEKKEDDSKLEEYSKGVQGRIAKLTRKMREAERREAAALQYADSLEKKRKIDASRLAEVNTEYTTKLEENVTSAMESAQNELRMAIEAQDATLQVTANKKIAALALENANLQMRKKQKPVEQETPVQLSDGGRLPEQTPRALPEADPVAEEWAAKNRWFGQDRAMTFTAFEIHKDLVDKEGVDPKSDEYYTEIDKRIRVDFPHKFDNNETIATTKPVQSVASANRSIKSGRKTMRLTSSQVAIAKKLGVPLEEYAKQLKLTEGA